MKCVLIILMLLKLGLSQADSNTKDEVKEILEFLHQGEEQIKSTVHKEIVFVLGATGTGKSTLVHLLAGNPSFLRSVASDVDSDDFIIEHLYEDKIGNVTFQSRTIYPDLIIDDNNVHYYDCPGFSDTRTTSIEIATTYFTKKAINFADRLKIVFVVNFNSMLRGTSSRNDFAQFVQHATEFLKNVSHYKSAIMLVASKVPVYAGQVGGDEKMINKVRGFLKEYRQFVIDEADDRTDSTDANSMEVDSNKLDLIDTFLTNDRIVLFKRPNVAGLLSQLPEVMKNREELRQSISKKINFVEMNGEDFAYTLSDRSKLKITGFVEAINGKITKLFEQINRTVIDHYSNKYVNFNDMGSMKNELDNVIRILSRISDSNWESSIASSVTEINQLKIQNLHRILDEIDNHMGYMKFLATVHDKPITRRTSDWSGALRSCVDYLTKERKWYSFADTLLDRLSAYDVQSNVSKYDVTDVERWSVGESIAGSGIRITSDNFANFLKKVMAFELVTDAEPSTSKIDLLNNILTATVKSRTTYTCHDDRMTVKGNFVKFSDLINYGMGCGWPNVQLIEVFGLSTIFFDLDFQRKANLVVIAPKWYIVHAHVRISLDGADGTDLDSSFDVQNKWLEARPGMPGENAHHFFGYADEIVNAENLFITAVGGNGGRGQNGYNGTDGQDIATPADGSSGDNLGQYAKIVTRKDVSDAGFLYFNRKKWELETFQSYAHCPSINGMGGSGGFGGYSGTIEMNGMTGIKTSIRDGAVGSNGLPGKCGKAYDKTKLFQTKFTSCKFWFFCGHKITWNSRKFSDSTCLQNCRSSTLVNVQGISKPKTNDRPNAAFSIDQYKSFVRQSLHRMNPKSVANFLRSMEENAKIRAVYETTSFIDDFYQLEKQFHRLKDDDIVVYYYKSLLERILEYVTNRSNKLPANERNILANLYTAGLSKICKIRSGTEQNLIVDIGSYLDVAVDHIRLIETSGKRVVLNQFKKEYRRDLETKINDNHDIIARDIMPAIEQFQSQTDIVIESLLVKLLEEKNSVAYNADRYGRMRRKLNDFIVPRGVIKVVKIAADIASLFSGYGTVVGKTLNAVNQIANAFTNGNEANNHMPSTKISLDEWTDNHHRLENSARLSQQQKSKSLLTIVDDVLKIVSEFSFDELSEPMKVVRKKLIGVKRVDLSSDEIDLMQNDVQNIIRKKSLQLKTPHSRNETTGMEALNEVSKKLSVLQSDMHLFSKYSSDDHKMDEIESVMVQSQARLLEFNNLERDLQLTIRPMVQHMRTSLTELSNKMNDHKMPSFEAIKWSIQNILKHIRYQMQQSGSGDVKLNGQLFHLFDKLDGAICTLSNIFDRIQIYEDQVRLSNYIANIESADFTFEMNASSEESDNLNRLNLIIQSNVLLTIFDNALNGFKQIVFPFADFYLRRFNLPPQLEMETNWKTLVKRATEELMNLKLTLKEHHSSSINPNDNLIQTADFSSDFLSSQPFYVWTGDEHIDTMKQLIAGRNITLKADITKGPKLNAVKFQYLEIHLKSADSASQAKLDKFLGDFDVTIIHHGNSYYRCDDKFYLITSPTQRIVYSFEKDSSGLPIRSNNVYRKMRNGDFVLSPYALLTISLNARHVEQFGLFNFDFGESFDLELTGRGQYLNANIDVCFDLEKYYAAEEVVNEFQSVG